MPIRVEEEYFFIVRMSDFGVKYPSRTVIQYNSNGLSIGNYLRDLVPIFLLFFAPLYRVTTSSVSLANKRVLGA
jgi:hypothetical protein